MVTALPHCVIFDMDGVLIDSEPLWREAEIEIFGKHGISLTEDDCRRCMGLRLNEVVAFWYGERNVRPIAPQQMEREVLNRVSELIAAKGEPLPGVHRLINALRQKRIPLAVASSSPFQLVHAVVRKLELVADFQVLASAQFMEFGKPHPQIFLDTARKMKATPHRCWVIEDSFNGMISALAARMQVCVVPAPEDYNDHRWAAATQKVFSLDEWAGQLPF